MALYIYAATKPRFCFDRSRPGPKTESSWQSYAWLCSINLNRSRLFGTSVCCRLLADACYAESRLYAEEF